MEDNLDICTAYLDLCNKMNACNPDIPEEDSLWNILVQEFQHHISTCKNCLNCVYTEGHTYKYSTGKGTKCKRCGSPPGSFCLDGCEDLHDTFECNNCGCTRICGCDKNPLVHCADCDMPTIGYTSQIKVE